MVDMVIGVTVFIQRACKPTAVNYRFTNQPIWLDAGFTSEFFSLRSRVRFYHDNKNSKNK